MECRGRLGGRSGRESPGGRVAPAHVVTETSEAERFARGGDVPDAGGVARERGSA